MGMKILQEERDIYYSAPEEIACARADMMNALGRRLMEMLADLPEGKDVRVSYMEVRNRGFEGNPLTWHYKMRLAVQEIPDEGEPGGGAAETGKFKLNIFGLDKEQTQK